METLQHAPGHSARAARRPLLLRPDENDSPEAGACADFNGGTGCEPYHPVQLPSGIENLLAAADHDQNVTCAVFQDAVKATFGPNFNPVTWGEHCFFVEATHTLILRCNVDGVNPPSDYGRRPDLYSDRQETQIAGKPAVTFWDLDRSQYDVYLSLFGDLNHPGNLHINVETRPGRGDTFDTKRWPSKTQPRPSRPGQTSDHSNHAEIRCWKIDVRQYPGKAAVNTRSPSPWRVGNHGALPRFVLSALPGRDVSVASYELACTNLAWLSVTRREAPGRGRGANSVEDLSMARLSCVPERSSWSAHEAGMVAAPIERFDVPGTEGSWRQLVPTTVDGLLDKVAAS